MTSCIQVRGISSFVWYESNNLLYPTNTAACCFDFRILVICCGKDGHWDDYLRSISCVLCFGKDFQISVYCNFKLWRLMNNKKMTPNKMLCDNKQNCQSWRQIRIFRRRLGWFLIIPLFSKVRVCMLTLLQASVISCFKLNNS